MTLCLYVCFLRRYLHTSTKIELRTSWLKSIANMTLKVQIVLTSLLMFRVFCDLSVQIFWGVKGLHFVTIQCHTKAFFFRLQRHKFFFFFFLIKHDILAISGICGERLSLTFFFHAYESQYIKPYQKGALGKTCLFPWHSYH